MRAVVIVSLMLALGGCQTVGSGLGMGPKNADRGGGGHGKHHRTMDPGASNTATTGAKPSSQEPTYPPLPNGLVGDTEHHAYSSDAPKN